MKEYKVGQIVVAKLSGGRLVEATITAIQKTTHGTRLRVSFDNKTAVIYESEIVAPK